MRRWRLIFALCALACETKPTPQSTASAAPRGSLAVSAVASASNHKSAPPKSSSPPQTDKPEMAPAEKVRRGTLTGVAASAQGYRGQLKQGGRVAVVFATKRAPLAPRAPRAHAGLAREVAPASVAPTAMRRLSLRDILASAADKKTRKKLADELRVLADGRVEATLVLLPEKRMVTMEIGRMLDGTRVRKWETELMSRTPPTEPLALLAAYQRVLAVDALCQNLLRARVVVDDQTSSVLALEDNDAFSAAGRDGSVGDPLPRLSRHLFFSKSLEGRLRKLDREHIEAALRTSEAGLLVTPKQVDEVMQRRDALLRLLDRRIKQRGRVKTLALP